MLWKAAGWMELDTTFTFFFFCSGEDEQERTLLIDIIAFTCSLCSDVTLQSCVLLVYYCNDSTGLFMLTPSYSSRHLTAQSPFAKLGSTTCPAMIASHFLRGLTSVSAASSSSSTALLHHLRHATRLLPHLRPHHLIQTHQPVQKDRTCK